MRLPSNECLHTVCVIHLYFSAFLYTLSICGCESSAFLLATMTSSHTKRCHFFTIDIHVVPACIHSYWQCRLFIHVFSSYSVHIFLLFNSAILFFWCCVNLNTIKFLVGWVIQTSIILLRLTIRNHADTFN